MIRWNWGGRVLVLPDCYLLSYYLHYLYYLHSYFDGDWYKEIKKGEIDCSYITTILTASSSTSWMVWMVRL